MTPARAILICDADNVATAMADIPAGSEVVVERSGRPVVVQVGEVIPRGHKYSLRAIGKGGKVVKYGQVIGLASSAIAPGRHVHSHNVESRRGRGDLRKAGER